MELVKCWFFINFSKFFISKTTATSFLSKFRLDFKNFLLDAPHLFQSSRTSLSTHDI
ncbi:hypothetical protein Peur_007606 [Populus x canadensis]